MAYVSTPPRTPKRLSTVITSPQTPKNSPKSPKSPNSSTQSPRNPQNTAWVRQRERRTFLQHLEKWSMSHDSCPHFHGTIGIMGLEHNYRLGEPAQCVLTISEWKDWRMRIVVILRAPRREHGDYKLVVHSAAGWLEAGKFFSQEYFRLQRKVQHSERRVGRRETEENLARRSQSVHEPETRNTIAICPLFHPFVRLPLELQQMIFELTIGKKEGYRPPASIPGFGYCDGFPASVPTTSLATLFSISKVLNAYLKPWIYRTTDFHFSAQGLTDFLWRCGPENRSHVKKLTLALGSIAILHCIKWLAPDPVFKLFKPTHGTSPRALQYFWRCQIQDLLQEVHLNVLTIDICGIPIEDLLFVVGTIRQAFGSVERVRITSSGMQLDHDDERITALMLRENWARLCRTAFKRYRSHVGYFDTLIGGVDALHWEMKEQTAFFKKAPDTWREG